MIGDQYEINGYAIWNNVGISEIYDSVDDLKMTLLLFNRQGVVHQELFRVKGSFNKRIKFKRKFRTNSQIYASTLTDIQTILTEE